MNITDIKKDTPRLIMEFPDGDKFGWGMVGTLPLLPLIGYTVRVQSDLMYKHPQECPHRALVIVLDEETDQFDWWVHSAVPMNVLVGALEVVKTSLLGMYVARMQQAQTPLVGLDGRPLRM